MGAITAVLGDRDFWIVFALTFVLFAVLSAVNVTPAGIADRVENTIRGNG